MKGIKRVSYVLLLLLFAVQQPLAAQESQEDTQESLVVASQNPIASMISMPFQFNWNMGIGDYNRTQTIINIQPVLPVKIGKSWNLINRIILPVMVQPDYSVETGSTTGLGMINYSAFFSPEPIGKIALGFGPSLLIPTNTASALGDGQFSIGPSVVLFYMLSKKWTMGFVAAQNWAYYTPNTANKHSSFFTQYFINYNLKNAWSIGTSPTINVNWDAEEGEKATVPIGLSLTKVTKLGNQATKFGLGYYYNVVRPTAGAKSGQIQFMLVFLFPR